MQTCYLLVAWYCWKRIISYNGKNLRAVVICWADYFPANVYSFLNIDFQTSLTMLHCQLHRWSFKLCCSSMGFVFYFSNWYQLRACSINLTFHPFFVVQDVFMLFYFLLFFYFLFKLISFFFLDLFFFIAEIIMSAIGHGGDTTCTCMQLSFHCHRFGKYMRFYLFQLYDIWKPQLFPVITSGNLIVDPYIFNS